MRGASNKFLKHLTSPAAVRLTGAAGFTVLLFVFLATMRLLDAGRVPDQTLRPMETIKEVAAVPPPPPPENLEEPPPPPPPAMLPSLELQIESTAPALAASLDPRVDLTMRPSDFELEVDPTPQVRPPRPPVSTSAPPVVTSRPPQVKSTYDAGELDAKPRLVNRPSASYPTTMLRRGVREGKVLLEVSISTSGRLSVRRVISSSHPDFTKMARSFAARARFTVPKKNGRPVTAIYRWPLILKP
jgi:protein TonB